MRRRASRLEFRPNQRQHDENGPLIPPRSLSHQPRPPLPASARSQVVNDEQSEYNGDACVSSHPSPLPLGHHRVPALPDASFFPHSARLEPRRLIKSHRDLLLAETFVYIIPRCSSSCSFDTSSSIDTIVWRMVAGGAGSRSREPGAINIGGITTRRRQTRRRRRAAATSARRAFCV
jgi:hypothetical protein